MNKKLLIRALFGLAAVCVVIRFRNDLALQIGKVPVLKQIAGV